MRQTNLQFTKLVVVNKVDSTQHSLKISTPAAHKNLITLPKSKHSKNCRCLTQSEKKCFLGGWVRLQLGVGV
jgi:hypothetical protein